MWGGTQPSSWGSFPRQKAKLNHDPTQSGSIKPFLHFDKTETSGQKPSDKHTKIQQWVAF
jgi:hypothetical protein